MGISGCFRLKADVPDFVVKWCKKPHNSFHKGSSATLPELRDKVWEFESAWKAYAAANRITQSACPDSGDFTYIAVYRKFITDKINELDRDGLDWFANNHHYQSTKKVMSHLKDVGALDTMWSWWDTVLDYTDPDCRKDKLCYTMAECVTFFDQNYSKHWECESYSSILCGCLKLCTPQVTDAKESEQSSWVFRTPSSIQSLMVRMLFPVKQACEEQSPVKQPPQKKRRGKEADSDKPLARAWTWGDELETGVRSICSAMTPQDSSSRGPVEDVIHIALKYCFLNTLPTWVTKTTSWDAVWTQLKMSVLTKSKEHVDASRWLLEGSQNFHDVDAILKHLETKKNSEAAEGKEIKFADVQDEKLSEALAEVSRAFADMDTVLSFTLFLKSTNAKMPLNVQLAYQTMAQDIGSVYAEGAATPTLKEMMVHCYDGVIKAFQGRHLRLLRLLLEINVKFKYIGEDITELTNGVFDSWRNAVDVAKLPITYALNFLHSMISDPERKAEIARVNTLACTGDHFSLLAMQMFALGQD